MNWPSVIIVGSLAGTLLASTLAYALRTMSRVTLEKELMKRGRQVDLDQLNDQRDNLALTASIGRIGFNVSLIAGMLYAASGVTVPSPLWFCAVAAMAGLLLLIFSVAIPNAWAAYGGEKLIAVCWSLLRTISVIVSPLVYFMRLFDELVRRLSGINPQQHAEEEAAETTEEILAAVSEGTAEGAVDDDQRKMIEGIISFRDLQAGQIMMPRTDMITINVNEPLDKIRDKILRDGLSRLPVHDGNLDNIIGILYAKDLLQFLGTSAAAAAAPDIRKLMRPPLFVPHSKPLRDLLRQFRAQRVHIAIVLDEFGGTAGLITSEDILEEIVGDIADEYEKMPASQMRRIDVCTVEVDGRTNITDLNRELDSHLPENQDYQTISGLVIHELGTIPGKGAAVTIEGITVTVTESDVRRIKKVVITLPPQADGGIDISPTEKQSA
ncbi:MAG: hemolysin family protein [Phycisphaerae bacterium]